MRAAICWGGALSDGTKRAAWETNSELAEKKIQFISIFFDHQCRIFQNRKLKILL